MTELGMFRFKDGKVILEKIAPEIDLDYIKSVTELDYEVSPNLTQMVK